MKFFSAVPLLVPVVAHASFPTGVSQLLNFVLTFMFLAIQVAFLVLVSLKRNGQPILPPVLAKSIFYMLQLFWVFFSLAMFDEYQHGRGSFVIVGVAVLLISWLYRRWLKHF